MREIFVSRLVFFANTPPKPDISVCNVSMISWLLFCLFDLIYCEFIIIQFFSSTGQRRCDLLPSFGVRRPSVHPSFFPTLVIVITRDRNKSSTPVSACKIRIDQTFFLGFFYLLTYESICCCWLYCIVYRQYKYIVHCMILHLDFCFGFDFCYLIFFSFMLLYNNNVNSRQELLRWKYINY